VSEPGDLKRVKAMQAFRWICPECQTENFDRAVEVVFEDPEAERVSLESMGLKPGEGIIVEAPGTVTCRSCLAMFALED